MAQEVRQGRELISLHHLDCVGVYDLICTFVAPNTCVFISSSSAECVLA